MAQVKNQSEHMFVEWAQGIQADHYDVERVAELLRGLGEERLEGLDVGGGIGRYAQLVCDKVPGCRMVVLDKSELAEESFVDDERLQLTNDDYFTFEPGRRYDFLIFKTVLHHFISDSEQDTSELQQRALKKAHQLLRPGGLLLIEENFYQGVLGDDAPGKLIYAVTKQRWIENMVRRLGANTAGEGVRFRSMGSWSEMLQREGFVIRSLVRSPTWGKHWPLWQRIPLLSSGRYQGVLEAHAVAVTGEPEQNVQVESERGISPSWGFAQPLMARMSSFWQGVSSRVRWAFTLVAVTGPITLTTCAMSEA